MREREGRWKEAEKERVSLCERTKGRENDDIKTVTEFMRDNVGGESKREK